MQVFEHDLQYYVDRITPQTVFSWTRYGDGEWAAITGSRERTSSHSQWLNIRTLQKAMKRSIIQAYRTDNYIVATRPGAEEGGIEGWLAKNAPGLTFHDERVFYKASKHGHLYPFIKAVRDLDWPVVIVGPERLRKLPAFDIAQHIVIPGRDCWAVRDNIIRQVIDFCGQVKAFVFFSAGPATKPMIWELHGRIGGSSFLFDAGSLLDPYVGEVTRTYHKYLRNHPELIRRNLGVT